MEVLSNVTYQPLYPRQYILSQEQPYRSSRDFMDNSHNFFPTNFNRWKTPNIQRRKIPRYQSNIQRPIKYPRPSHRHLNKPRPQPPSLPSGLLDVLPSAIDNVIKRFASAKSKIKVKHKTTTTTEPPVIWFPNQNEECDQDGSGGSSFSAFSLLALVMSVTNLVGILASNANNNINNNNDNTNINNNNVVDSNEVNSNNNNNVQTMVVPGAGRRRKRRWTASVGGSNTSVYWDIQEDKQRTKSKKKRSLDNKVPFNTTKSKQLNNHPLSINNLAKVNPNTDAIVASLSESGNENDYNLTFKSRSVDKNLNNTEYKSNINTLFNQINKANENDLIFSRLCTAEEDGYNENITDEEITAAVSMDFLVTVLASNDITDPICFNKLLCTVNVRAVEWGKLGQVIASAYTSVLVDWWRDEKNISSIDELTSAEKKWDGWSNQDCTTQHPCQGDHI